MRAYREAAALEPAPRSPGSPPSLRSLGDDSELVCATELHRRADRIRRFVLVPTLLAGIVLGVCGYLALRELFFLTVRAHQPYVTGLLTVLPSFVASLRLARWLSDSIVRARIDGWTAALAEEHRIDAAVLDDHVRLIRGNDQ